MRVTDSHALVYKGLPSFAPRCGPVAQVGEYSGVENFVWMPPSLPASGTNILSDGVYLCEAGSYMLLYIGQHVRREYIIDVGSHSALCLRS